MLSKIKSLNFRHYICAGITLLFIVYGIFKFPYAAQRLWESLVDIYHSVVSYFAYLRSVFSDESPTLNSTVNNLSACPFVPIIDIPKTWQLICDKWGVFWHTFYSVENLSDYLSRLGDWSLWLYLLIMTLLPFVLMLIVAIEQIFTTHRIADNQDTFFLRVLKRVSDYTYRPLKRAIISFFVFLKENKKWYISWIIIWAFYFNFFSIFVELIAYYLYICFARDLSSIFIQVYKLMADLSVVMSFFPVFVWALFFMFFAYRQSINIAYDNLRHNESKNQGFIEERGVVTIITGPPGAGKTLLGTDIALSEEVRLRNMAFEIILESDLKFPNFPWINLERDLKKACYSHEVFNIPSCRRWLRNKYKAFRRRKVPARIWDYDLHRYPTKYNNELEIQDIWQVIDDYACAYFVYTIQSSLLISNYSIRVDNVLMDMGNFPLWDSDFFARDPRLHDSLSRHAHILDWDMLRLGKIMLEKNPNRFAFGFGVYVITELNQERKNNRKLSDIKASDDEVNQKNDLFEPLVKLSRHACLIANRVFVVFIADLQRTGDIALELLELGEVINISSVGKFVPVIPFWSPYWLVEGAAKLFGLFFNSIYHSKYRYYRSDNTAFMYIIKKIQCKLNDFVVRKNNLFNSRTLELELEAGKADGEKKKRKYYEASKKIFSKRFSSDAHAGIFIARAKYNEVGINDLIEYVTERASEDELLLQHSFMQLEWQNAS